MRKILSISIALILTMTLISCGKKKMMGSGQFNTQEKGIIVMTQNVTPSDLEKFIQVTGILEGKTDVTLYSELSGRVTVIDKKLGEWVNAGESIGKIDNEDYQNQLEQAEANLLAAQAAYENANIQMQASQRLFEQQSISETEFLTAQASLKSAEAAVKGATATLKSAQRKLEHSEFIAPVSGYISEMNLEVGEYFAAGKVVANIVDKNKLLIRTGAGESDIVYLRKGNQVVISCQGKDYAGKLTGIGIKPATDTGAYPIEIELDNPEGDLLPGMIVKARIQAKTFKNIIYTSIENLREKYGKYYVYVIDQDNRAAIRVVELGEKVSQNVIILSGLREGDKLVVDGIDSLSEGSLVEIKTGFDNNGR